MSGWRFALFALIFVSIYLRLENQKVPVAAAARKLATAAQPLLSIDNIENKLDSYSLPKVKNTQFLDGLVPGGYVGYVLSGRNLYRAWFYRADNHIRLSIDTEPRFNETINVVDSRLWSYQGNPYTVVASLERGRVLFLQYSLDEQNRRIHWGWIYASPNSKTRIAIAVLRGESDDWPEASVLQRYLVR